MKWYDVYFSLNGFMKINALNEEDAREKAEEILEDCNGSVEHALGTGVGAEITDIYGEDEYK